MILSTEAERELRYALAPISAYYAATRALTHRRIARDEALALGGIARLMTILMLVQLTRETRDWCAWVPLLLVVKRVRATIDSRDLRAAEHNLRLLARRLLDAQGFGRVRVDDVLAHPPRLQHAVLERVGGGRV